MDRTAGIHHVTAMASDAQRNRDFYEGVLGLRLVKRTVNFDDPGTHHLYYGDGVGSPGTILTFFPFAGIRAGVPGTGVVSSVALAVPEGAVPAWEERLRAAGVPAARTGASAPTLTLRDPDGIAIELVEAPQVTTHAVWQGVVDAAMAVRGVEGVTLSVRDAGRTAEFMEHVLGLGRTGDGLRGPQALGGGVRLLQQADLPRVRMGSGTVHHLAFRVPDGPRQAAWREDLLAIGANVSPVMDRDYFTSIYFHEPGGVLLEIATDPPGFTRDEDVDELGSALRLPHWAEPHRADIEAVLPPLEPARAIGGRA